MLIDILPVLALTDDGDLLVTFHSTDVNGQTVELASTLTLEQMLEELETDLKIYADADGLFDVANKLKNASYAFYSLAETIQGHFDGQGELDV